MLLLCVVVLACDEVVDCDQQTTNDFFFVDLRNAADGSQRTDTFNTVTLGNNGMIIFDTMALSKFQLPLDPLSSSALYIFEHNSGSDSLRVSYINQANIIDEDCDIKMVYSNLDVTFTTFDSVRIVEKSFLIGVTRNLQIFH